MRRLIASLLLLAGFLCGASAQHNAMFVYRNDGVINAFLKSDVDSLVCSQIDVDSLLHSDYVVQEIWTADSIYRIPRSLKRGINAIRNIVGNFQRIIISVYILKYCHHYNLVY